MGNLCSSGAERAEKKEDNQLPDKPKDGEDEALLSKAGAGVTLDASGVQVSVEGGGGGDGGGGGFGGVFGGVVESGEGALAGLSKSVEEEGQKVTASGQSAFNEAVESGKDAAAKGVEDATAAATKAASSAKSAAESAVAEGAEVAEQKANEGYRAAKEKVEEVVQQGKDKISGAVGSAQSGITGAVSSAESGLASAKNDAESMKDNVQQAASTAVDETSKTAQSAVDTVSSGVETAKTEVGNVKSDAESGLEAARTEAEGLRSSAEGAVAENVAAARETATDTVADTQKSVVGGIKDAAAEKLEEAKATAADLAETAKQTAENKVNEGIEAVKASASEAATTVSESVSAKVAGMKEGVSGATQAATDKVDELQQSALEKVESAEQSVEDVKQNAGETFSNVQAEAGQQLQSAQANAQDFAASASEGAGQVRIEATNAVDFAQNAGAAKFEEGRNAMSNFQQEANDAASHGVERLENVANPVAESAGDAAQGATDLSQELQEDGNFGFLGNVPAAAKGAVQSGVEYVKDQVVEKVQGFVGGGQNQEAAVEPMATQAVQQMQLESAAPPSPFAESEENFLDKAKSLLEAHRNSIDSSKVPEGDLSSPPEAAQQTEDSVEGIPDADVAAATDASHEATARDFVESIIEKATSLVSESMGQNQPATEESSPSDQSEASVERGEETLAPKKRNVMFVSPQLSEKSSSLSSPPELSPPPPPESDLSPPSESTNSSISQGDLVEREELLLPPPPPPQSVEYSSNENNNNNNNVMNNNAEDDDESIQRVAMEVTAKAVQDAIKIVTENGTGSALNSSGTILSNDLGVSSPSSGENEDEEMTTTDSSQVERGSSVSDLTDTSIPGSVSESLSSYDPGAVFRQDIANMSDLAMSPVDTSACAAPGSQPPPAVTTAASNANDLMSFEDGSTSQGDTPTPTNTAGFDSYPPPPPPPVSGEDVQNSEDGNPPPPPPFSSEVPSSLPTFDDFSSSPGKPTIIINSPDSAHHTNGSSEDVSSPQTEALI